MLILENLNNLLIIWYLAQNIVGKHHCLKIVFSRLCLLCYGEKIFKYQQLILVSRCMSIQSLIFCYVTRKIVNVNMNFCWRMRNGFGRTNRTLNFTLSSKHSPILHQQYQYSGIKLLYSSRVLQNIQIDSPP